MSKEPVQAQRIVQKRSKPATTRTCSAPRWTSSSNPWRRSRASGLQAVLVTSWQ